MKFAFIDTSHYKMKPTHDQGGASMCGLHLVLHVYKISGINNILFIQFTKTFFYVSAFDTIIFVDTELK